MRTSTHPRTRAALVVEDDATIRDTVAALLEDEGFEVTTATTLARARHVLFESKHPVSVVLLDLSLADGDGAPLVEELHRAGARSPALVLLSASPQRLIPLATTFAVPYVMKPFDVGVLATTVAVANDQRMQPHQGAH